MSRRLIAALLALAALPALAQDAYPSRPITLIVPFPPGGVADITGRPTAIALEKILKQPVVLANRQSQTLDSVDFFNHRGHVHQVPRRGRYL